MGHEVKHIAFGVTKGHSYSFGTATTNLVFKINPRLEIITTSREIVRVDSGIITSTVPHKSSTGVYCPSFDALITVTAVQPEFSVFLLNHTLKEPVASGIPLDQIGIYHVLFDDTNGTIVTFGNGIKTWYFDCLRKESRRILSDNVADIRERATFAQFFTAFMMVVPCLDTFNHRIFVPTSDGLLCYDYDGNLLPSPLQHNNHWFTLFAVNPFSKKMLTSDRDEALQCKAERAAAFKTPIVTQGVQYWRRDGTLGKELPFISASLYTAFFINKEFVVVVDLFYMIHIIDLKTMRFFPCMRIENKPSHIYFQHDSLHMRLVVCSVNLVRYYNICVPWRFWLSTQIAPVSILRCPRLECAARIAVQLVDSSIRLFTPYSVLLTLCHSASPSSPVSVVVDRGVPGVSLRDQIFVVLENGIVQIFNANECPLVTIKRAIILWDKIYLTNLD